MRKTVEVVAREYLKAFVQASNDLVFTRLGIRLVNSGRPTRNYLEFFRHVKKLGFHPKTVIDVGVAYGTADLYQPFPDAKFYLIEPVKEFEPYIRLVANTYNVEYHLAAAGAAPGSIPIHIHSDP
jgi:hypothetical protein